MVSMNKIKTYVRRVKFWFKHDFLTVENVVLMLAIILCLVWTYQSIMAMTRNWELSEKLAAERKELELVSVEVEAAELENDYYRSNEYQELVARKYMDKQWPGEKMVILPENTEEAKQKHKTIAVVETETEKEEYSNMEKWLKFLFPLY